MRQHRYLLGLMIVFFFCDANRNVATAQDIPLFALHDWQWHNDEGWKALNNKAYAKAEERFKLAIKELMPYHPRSQRLLARSYCDLARAALSPGAICRRPAPGEMGPRGSRRRSQGQR